MGERPSPTGARVGFVRARGSRSPPSAVDVPVSALIDVGELTLTACATGWWDEHEVDPYNTHQSNRMS